MYMCRWPNGDCSFVSAPNQEDAIVMLDEWGDAELADLTSIDDFMVSFCLKDDGDLELEAFGELTGDHISDHAYPILTEARRRASTDPVSDHLTPAGEEQVREAVRLERKRMSGEGKERTRADTEAGRAIQEQLGASAVLANRVVKQAAGRILAKTPTSGPKQ